MKARSSRQVSFKVVTWFRPSCPVFSPCQSLSDLLLKTSFLGLVSYYLFFIPIDILSYEKMPRSTQHSKSCKTLSKCAFLFCAVTKRIYPLKQNHSRSCCINIGSTMIILFSVRRIIGGDLIKRITLRR